ncbi:MAG: TIGR01212 family radical SAM protein [Lachnospiraceae bacterium]|nr:TIGR01212 family radical SAM protein [Lachnospiraceae bacterium]
MYYYSLNQYLKDKFGCKVYKIALNGGFSCPNRDGLIDTRGCIFCSKGGSGEYAGNAKDSIREQIEKGKRLVEAKTGNGKYIAYFQAYTGTYASVERLRSLYSQAIKHPDIVALSIATRPDCIPKEVLDLLVEMNKIKPVWIELGLQTIHEKTAEYIRRGYPLSVYDQAVSELRSRGIEVITHVILGLPGENREDMLNTVDYVCRNGVNGIKLQLLHILKGTDLLNEYESGEVRVMSEEEYVSLIIDCLRIIPKSVVIHRMTGDGDKKILVAPEWSKNKKHVLNSIKTAIDLTT